MVFRLYWKQAGDRQNMIIRQLNIKNSGEIHDKTLEFSPGINVLYGENESERAIVHTYIKNMFLGDISEAIYDNAVFAAKLKSPTEQDLARELQKFMTGYQGTADSSMDLGRAMQMLKMSRKGYLVQADRKQKETEQERQKLLTRMDDIISDLNDLNGKLDQINEKEESLRMHPGDENGAVILDERMAQAKAKRNSFAMGMLISAAAGIFRIDFDCDYSGQCFGKSDRSGYCSCVGGILWKTAAEVCKGISEENTDEETLGIQAGETQMQ